ncbi:short-chain dehydrogenase [Aspergillus heterothallicus]
MSPATPYAHLHTSPSGPGDARPTALQIIADENLTHALPNTTIVLTGATSGIGLETARALLTTGATLYLPVRSIPSARASLSTLLSQYGEAQIQLVEMDISSLASIKRAAAEILSLTKQQINVLIANAGIMGLPTKTLSADGFEMHFAVNYLGHFYLFQMLKDALLATASATGRASRVVVVSSSTQRAGNVNIADGWDYNFETAEYSFHDAYNNAKLAAVWMANGIERVYGGRGLHATSLHPGAIDTNISRYVGREFVAALLAHESIAKVVKSPEQGAATTVWAAVGKEWEGRGGRYLENCGEAGEGVDDGQIFGTGFVPRTYDDAGERKLWGKMCALLKVEEQ